MIDILATDLYIDFYMGFRESWKVVIFTMHLDIWSTLGLHCSYKKKTVLPWRKAFESIISKKIKSGNAARISYKFF